MQDVLQQLPAGSAVAIIRLRSLGDCVLTTPAIRLLKQHRPDLRIAVVVEDRFASIYEGNPDVDAILPPAIAAVRRWRPRLCVNLHGGTRSMTLTGGSGAQFRAGFVHFRAALGLYNVRIPRAQEILGVERIVHTAEHVASAFFFLGVPPAPIPRARLVAAAPPQRPPYAVLHPVAATPEKTWPAERFRAAARHLRTEHGLDPVFIGGPGDDLTGFAGFETLVGAPLADTKRLLSGASLFIGNDSGPAHMAAAFGVPVVVIFGPSDSVVWAPWQVEAQVLAAKGGRIDGIEVEQVVRAVDRLRVIQ
jgi:ADP-heptose:LPS heptosyltransferase